VALPLLGTGPGCLDPEEAVAVLLPLLLESLRQRPREFVIVADGEYERELVARELRLRAADSGEAGGGPARPV
jgi:hypothetical protein